MKSWFSTIAHDRVRWEMCTICDYPAKIGNRALLNYCWNEKRSYKSLAIIDFAIRDKLQIFKMHLQKLKHAVKQFKINFFCFAPLICNIQNIWSLGIRWASLKHHHSICSNVGYFNFEWNRVKSRQRNRPGRIMHYYMMHYLLF